MANTLDGGSFAEMWMKEAQTVYDKHAIFPDIADTRFSAQFGRDGYNLVNFSYPSGIYAKAYTRGTDRTNQDVTNTNETLSIATDKYISIYIDDFDGVQESFSNVEKYGAMMGNRMRANLDSRVLAEYANATHDVDAADMEAGTAGLGFTATAANVVKSLLVGKKKMSLLNVSHKMLFAALSPNVIQLLEEYLIDRGTVLADRVVQEGFRRSNYKGVLPIVGCEIYETNNLTNTFVLSLATQPITGDTLVLTYKNPFTGSATITITFKTSLTGAGTYNEVYTVTNVDTTRVNLAHLINNTGTVDTNHSDFSAANRLILNDIALTATDSPSADTCTFVWKGSGTISLSETLTDATDTFTATKQIQHNLMGIKGSTKVAVQLDPKVEKQRDPDRFGDNYSVPLLDGIKTFNDGAKGLVDINVRFDGVDF